MIRSKVVDADGNLTTSNDVELSSHRESAIKRLKTLARMKEKRRGWLRLAETPAHVLSHVEPFDVTWVSNEEMLAQMDRASRERYVVFADVTGIEDQFDPGIQYLAYENGSTDTVDVIDRYGELRSCFVSRLESLEPTEAAMELIDSMKGKKDAGVTEEAVAAGA
jgi:hypothetical protein